MPPPAHLGTYRPLLLVDAFAHGPAAQVDRNTPILPSRPWLEHVTINFSAATPEAHGIIGYWDHTAFNLPIPSAFEDAGRLYETAPSAIQRTAMMGTTPFTITVKKF